MTSSRVKLMVVAFLMVAFVVWFGASSGVPSIYVFRCGLGLKIKALAAERQMSVEDFLENAVSNAGRG